MSIVRSIRPRLALTLQIALIILFCTLPDRAEALPPTGALPGGDGDPLLIREDLESFIDGLMAAHFQAYRIPGAAVAVVKDGEILLAKGYGYADVEAQEPVDPSRTLFRIGSVSKLFTWTAVMQLVEQGRLDLDEDVNVYLAGSDVHVPGTFPEPITMGHLMNHTAGFEDRGVGLFSHDPADMQPLGKVLASCLPRRVRPPGEVTAYSNHGTALAGCVVERLSGMPWAAHIEEKILNPLDLAHTTVRQPVPEAVADDLALGYVYSPARARFELQPFEYVPAAPAGAVSASAADMARFMIAHLQHGRLGEKAILERQTAQQMQATSYLQDPRLGGIAHGFLEQPYGSLRTIGHGGDSFLFHAELRLIPSEGVGIFAVYNAPDGAFARDELVEAFLQRYFGRYAASTDAAAAGRVQAAQVEPAMAQGAPEGPPDDARPATAAYAGVYGPTRVPHTTLDRLIQLLSAISVRPDPAGGTDLLVTMSPTSGTLRFRQVELGLFQEIGGPGRISFEPGAAGQPDRILMGSAWMGEKLSWYEGPVFHVTLAVSCLILFLTAVLGWPAGWVRERWRRRREATGHSPGMPGFVRWGVGGLSAAFLVVLAGLALVLQDPFAIAFGVPGVLRAILILALIAALLSPSALIAAALVWRGRYSGLAGRLQVTLVALAAVAFALWLNHWNLIGFRF